MGLYFLFPTCQFFQQIQAEKNTPYELTATTDSCNIDLNTLMQIEGVERISPVINMNANLSFEEYALEWFEADEDGEFLSGSDFELAQEAEIDRD
jgi:hypothetical protein